MISMSAAFGWDIEERYRSIYFNATAIGHWDSRSSVILESQQIIWSASCPWDFLEASDRIGWETTAFLRAESPHATHACGRQL